MNTDALDKIPTETDWRDLPAYIGDETRDDIHYMYEKFVGKQWTELREYFLGGAISRAFELASCPPRVFQYYVQAFVDYILSNDAKEDSGAASSFLEMMDWRLGGEEDYKSVIEIYPPLGKCVDFIGSNQEWFDAPVDIYGSFSDKAEHIRKIVTYFQKGGKPLPR